ncbi:YHS domain-containing protein [bacterium]|nr:YHS domain-containing protein [bacterium]
MKKTIYNLTINKEKIMKSNSFKIIMSISILAVFLLSTFAISEETKPAEKTPQTLCPVMAGEINKDIFVDFQCQRIYFCCAGCKENFLKDPETYMKKIEEGNILLESIQKVCPVTGKDINKKFFKDYKGRRIYFCCEKCISEFDKDPDKYLSTLCAEKKEEPKEAPKAEESK